MSWCDLLPLVPTVLGFFSNGHQNQLAHNKETHEMEYKNAELDRQLKLQLASAEKEHSLKKWQIGTTLLGSVAGLLTTYISHKNASAASKREAETIIANMKRAHEQDMAKWMQQSEMQKQEFESKYNQLSQQQMAVMREKTEQLNKKFEQMDVSRQLSEKLKDEQHYIAMILQYLQQREQYIQRAVPLLKEMRDIGLRYKQTSETICVESAFLKKFECERNNSNYQLLVALGCVGVGKSTFCNRFVGDKSKFGRNDRHSNDNSRRNGSVFGVGTGIRACTQDISKVGIKYKNKNISIVDVPGASDGDGKDFRHGNNLAAYLRGCGGVNAFLVFFSCVDRCAMWFYELLRKYEQMLGKEFWNHVIIVATKADMQLQCNNVNCSTKQWKAGLANEIKNKLGLSVDLPVIVTGHNSFGNAINDLMTIIPGDKYNCKAIKSPIDELKNEAEVLRIHKEDKENDLKLIFTDCGKLDGKIQSINDNLNEMDKDIRNLQDCLGKSVRSPQKYDYYNQLTPLKDVIAKYAPDYGESSQSSNNVVNNYRNNSGRKFKPKPAINGGFMIDNANNNSYNGNYAGNYNDKYNFDYDCNDGESKLDMVSGMLNDGNDDYYVSETEGGDYTGMVNNTSKYTNNTLGGDKYIHDYDIDNIYDSVDVNGGGGGGDCGGDGFVDADEEQLKEVLAQSMRDK